MKQKKVIVKNILGVLGAPTTNGGRLRWAQSLVDLMKANALFPSPTPTVAAVQADIDKLRASDAAAKNRVAGAVGQRDADWKVVKDDLKDWLKLVEKEANLKPDHAAEILTGAGFALKKSGTRIQNDLTVKNGSVSGTVIVLGRGAQGAAHEWQMSKDQVNWLDLPTTMQARTQVTGLTFGTVVYFKHRTVGRTVTSGWTNPVSILVK